MGENDDAWMDEGGTFTARLGGSFTLELSMEVTSEPGQSHTIMIHHNGNQVTESQIRTNYDTDNIGLGSDYVSRVLILQLAQGDIVNVQPQSDSQGAGLNYVSFCVSSLNLE